MYGCKSWTVRKSEHWRIDVFELWCWRRLLRVPWAARRSNHSNLNQFWIFSGRTDVETEAPILWPPNAKNWHIEKDHYTGKDWMQEEKEMAEDEMVGWHHRLNGHEFGQALGVCNGQASLEWCMGLKGSDTNEPLNWTLTFIHDYWKIHKKPILQYVECNKEIRNTTCNGLFINLKTQSRWLFKIWRELFKDLVIKLFVG